MKDDLLAFAVGQMRKLKLIDGGDAKTQGIGVDDRCALESHTRFYGERWFVKSSNQLENCLYHTVLLKPAK